MSFDMTEMDNLLEVFVCMCVNEYFSLSGIGLLSVADALERFV